MSSFNGSNKYSKANTVIQISANIIFNLDFRAQGCYLERLVDHLHTEKAY